MDWGKAPATEHIQCLKVSSISFNIPFFFWDLSSIFAFSVGCGCGTFEWLLRVSLHSGWRMIIVEWSKHIPKVSFQKTAHENAPSDSDWSEGSRIWSEPGLVGKSTLRASFHQAWQVVISEKKEISRNVPINLNETNPEYVDECEDKFCELPPESAALFSYFNNIDLFHSYLQHFKGDLS